MSFLTLNSVRKSYGSLNAVEDLSLSVEQGELVTLLGPSGCGKSTTLQMIAGFVEVTGGSISMGGQSLGGIPANRRGIGIVFQSYALFPHMTVAGNVSFGLEMRQVPASERGPKVEAALELVHLSGLADRYPRQLSGGQQQRVALARALVIEPKLLLLDEPMSNLDAKLRDDMQIELRQLQRTLGITTILVTHDQNEAMALSDRVAVMNKGRIIQVDTPSQAYEQPADTFASTFLGKSNIFEAVEISRDSDISRLRSGEIVFQVLTGNLEPVNGRPFLCAIRPERIDLIERGKGILDGTVRAAIFLGNHWLFKVSTALGDILVFRQNMGANMPKEGETIGLSWQPASVRSVPRDQP